MTKFITRILILSFVFLLSGCGAYFNQPVGPQSARIGEVTVASKKLKDLPPPSEPIIVGVYDFKDQTGQYKPTDLGSTFSTAITQGATTILIKALEDSKWFRPIERENLNNLINERNIIRSTREEYRQPGDTIQQRMKPLLFAGILLEGGVISYDSNIITGGAGVRYFGIGASTKYRQDRITVYLRAVSTSSGEVLKTVYVSKTLLSQAVDVGLFRYVNFQRLLEVETGFTKNEPAQLAVTEAIEKAVEILIIEGISANIWSTKDGVEKNKEIVDNYLLEKQVEESTGLYEREYLKPASKSSLSLSAGTTLIDGDYSSAVPDFKAQLGYKFKLNPSFALGLDIDLFRLNSTTKQRNWWLGSSLNFEYKVLPNDRLSPYFYGGPGYMIFIGNNPSLLLQKLDGFMKVQAGIGFEYVVTPKVSFTINGDYNLVFSDEIDNRVNGRRNDFYYNFGVGVNYHFGRGRQPIKTIPF